jgi:long-chain acyl-CoA synthetase
MTHHPEVLSRYQHAIDKVNTHFSHIEQIKKFALLPVSWEATRNDGTEAELTPTMKLKRRIIMTKFSEDIDKLYI